MLLRKYPQTRSLLLILVILPLYASFGKNFHSVDDSNNRLLSTHADTSTSTLPLTNTATLTKPQFETPTTISGTDTTVTATPIGTILNPTQSTLSPTSIPLGTTTALLELTTTLTPNFTNTPGPTATFVPLPSITLLFPIETVAYTPEGLFVAESSSAIQPDGRMKDSPGRISARSILLIGTIMLLWVILSIFLIFYLQKLAE
jgi:hypothetical protein